MSVIKAENVFKKYNGHFALEDFNVDVNKGEIVALIGPNGAGKSTFVKACLGLVNLDRGSITLNGMPSNDPKSRSKVAYMPEKFNFYDFYKVRNVLKFFCELRSLSVSDAKIQEALDLLAIGELADKKVSSLSKGQLQRVGLCSLYLTEAEVFIFDEPFSGLDPLGIKAVKDLFVKLKEQGATVMINTHILSEMEKVADQIILINKGKLLYSGDISGEVKEQGLEDFFVNKVQGNS